MFRSLLPNAVLAFLLIGCSLTNEYSNSTIGHPFSPSLKNDTRSAYAREYLKVQNQDPSANFQKLRTLFLGTEYYKPWESKEHEAAIAIFNTIEDDDYALCLQLSQALIETNFTNLDAHFGAYQCHTRSGNNAQASYHAYVLKGLYQSILNSGDGLSPKTPYLCNSSNELRAFIRLTGKHLIQRETIDVSPRYIEKLTLGFDDAEEYELRYVDTSPALQHSFGVGLQTQQVKP